MGVGGCKATKDAHDGVVLRCGECRHQAMQQTDILTWKNARVVVYAVDSLNGVV